jgi:general secretion pathway protein I
MEQCVSADEKPPRNGLTSLRRSAEHGFTLVELMVALAVFSLVALTLIKLQGAIIRNSGEIAVRNVGQIVAHNLAVETLTDPRAPSLGESEGAVTNGGQQWRWRRVTKETADPKLVRIDIAVVDQTGRSAGVLTLARPIER